MIVRFLRSIGLIRPKHAPAPAGVNGVFICLAGNASEIGHPRLKNGQYFSSTMEASRAIGCRSNAVRTAFRRALEKDPSQCSVWVKGVEFLSAAQASKQPIPVPKSFLAKQLAVCPPAIIKADVEPGDSDVDE